MYIKYDSTWIDFLNLFFFFQGEFIE
jgi:hypothetical protein